MIHLFHGEQTENSRNELATLKEKFRGAEIIIIDGKTATVTDLKQATEAGTLFGDLRLIIVENLLSRRLNKKSSDADEISQWLTQLPTSFELVFWEEKELGKTILGILPKQTDIALFKPDRTIFTFVDKLRPNNEQLLGQLSEALGHDSAEMMFAMVVRQFRLLIMAKDLDKNNLGLSPWQAGKLTKQAAYFTLPQLIDLYQQLLDIDVKIKTGTTPFNLEKELELFLIKL